VVTRVLGFGAGGHGKVVVEALRAMGGFEVVGLLDPRKELWGTTVLGVPVFGDDDQMAQHYDGGVRHAFIGLGSGHTTSPRRRLYETVRLAGFEVVTAVHPRAVVSPSAAVGAAATVLAGAVVNAAARLGENVIVNTGAIVEHDCQIGDHVHVASGARLASAVVVGTGVHVGLGACVNQGMTIGEEAVIGSGAVVVADVEPRTIVVGVPARPLRSVGA
jgi:UDP-perosamine 4-acetyltransferase